MAIVYSRPDPYVRLLTAQLRAAGIEHNGRGGVAVGELACSRAFLGLLNLPERHYPRPLLFEVLSTWPMRQFELGSPIPTVRWERVSRDANIAGGEPSDAIVAGWIRRLDDFSAQAGSRLQQASEDWQRQRLDRTIMDARELGAFVTGLDARLGDIDEARSWDSVSGLCLALLSDLFGSIDEIRAWDQDGKRAYATLRSVLMGLSSLDAHGAPAGLGSIRDVIGAQLEAAIPRTGKFGQGIFVGPVSQILGLDLDRIWVVGMSEDLYPGSQREDALLPDAVRDRTPGLLTSRDRIARSRREFEAALHAAELVTVSFPRGDLRKSSERLPSRLLLPTLRHLTRDPDLPATEWHKASRVDGIVESPSFAGSVNTTSTPSTDQEWALRHVAAAGELDSPAFHAGRALRAARLGDDFTRFDGNLAGVEDLPDLATSGRLTSPTSLEGYAACPFAYFVKRLLRVEPVTEPTATGRISPLDLGNIFHYSMDRFLSLEKEAGTLPGPGEPWRPEHYDRLLAAAGEVIAEHGQAGRLGHVTLWGFEEPRVHQDLRRMLADDTAWRIANGSEPVDSELAFGFGDHPPVEIEVAGGTVRFVGSADKIDRAGSTVYVTDLKSGGRAAFTKIERGGNPTVDGTKLQLPIYAKAAKHAYGADAVEARYWFVREQGGRNQISLELTADLEETFSHVVGTLAGGIARGHFFKKPSKEPGYLWVDCEFCTPGGAGHTATRSGYERLSVHPDLLDLLDVIDPEAAARARITAGAESE
jgi:ATP-dependent helicase/nuclease subunit B